MPSLHRVFALIKEEAAQCKKHYCDFYHFALLLVYLCAWCRVFFISLSVTD